MSFDLSAVLKLLTRAILKLIQERRARTGEPEPAAPKPAPPPAPPVEAKATVRPSDRVLAAVIDLKLQVRAASPAVTDAAMDLADAAPSSERRVATASAASLAAEEHGRFRQAAIETQANWRDRHILATLAQPPAGADVRGMTWSQSHLQAPAAPAPAVDADLAQAQTNLRTAIQAYRSLETA